MSFFSSIWDFMKFMFVPISLMLLLFFGAHLIYVDHVSTHENVHEAIYDNYGIEAEVEITDFGYSGVTTVDGQEYQDKCAGTDCQVLHSMNEIVSYNNASLMGAIYIVGLILAFVGLLIYMALRELISIKFWELQNG